MKLIDILVEYGLNGWSWPDGVEAITQDSDKSINKYKAASGMHINENGTWKFSLAWEGYLFCSGNVKLLAHDYTTAIITREQYEAALAAKNYGWIEWGGGECPVEKGVLVDVKIRNGRTEYAQEALSAVSYASYPFWSKDDISGDIIAYRLHKSQEAVQGEASLNECIGHDAEPVWSGEGLPPVGCECKVDYGSVELIDGLSRPDDGDVVRVVSHEKTGFGTQVVVVYWNVVNGGGRAHALIPKCLRPLRTEAECKRDEVRKAMYAAMDIVDGDIADAIYDAIAAGKIPGVKLEDL